MTVRHFAWYLAITVVLVAGCAGTPAPSQTPTTASAPPSTAAATASPRASLSAVPATPAVATRSPLPSILPGEPWIAFQTTSAAGYAVHLIRPDGTGLHRWPVAIPGEQEHPDWSPDGERLVLNAVDGEGIHDLWIADVDGSDPTLVVDCQTPCLWANEPSWSPDGLTVAFQRAVLVDRRLRSTLELLDVASGVARVVLTMPDRQVVLAPRWAPDGQRLVVEVVHILDATPEAEPDGGSIGIVDLRKSAPKVRLLMDFASFAQSPDWSPTQDLIAFAQLSGPERAQADLVAIRLDGSGRRLITDIAKDGDAAVQPAFTADGKRLLFILTRAGKREAVMAVVGVDGSNLGPIGGSDYRDGYHPRLRPTP